MKIIVDISKKDFEKIAFNLKGVKTLMRKAIIQGILLPDNHGRIIDESMITACEWDGKHMHCTAPTIIDSEKD